MEIEQTEQIDYSEMSKAARKQALIKLGFSAKFIFLDKLADGASKYGLALYFNKKNIHLTEYQQGSLVKDKPTVLDAVWCLLSDANSYEESRNLTDFYKSFGYEDIEKAEKAYEGCKLASEAFKKVPSEIVEQARSIVQDY